MVLYYLLWYACCEMDTLVLELSSGRRAWVGVALWAMRRAQREARYETGDDVPVALGDAKSFMYSKKGADAGTLPSYSLLSALHPLVACCGVKTWLGWVQHSALPPSPCVHACGCVTSPRCVDACGLQGASFWTRTTGWGRCRRT